jgi:uncharacterized membrane protein YqjE
MNRALLCGVIVYIASIALMVFSVILIWLRFDYRIAIAVSLSCSLYVVCISAILLKVRASRIIHPLPERILFSSAIPESASIQPGAAPAA